MTRKSQASMEYLMTYAYAISAMIACSGALLYFGVIDLSSVFPQKCDFGPGLECQGFAFDGTSTRILLTNKMDLPIFVNSINLTQGVFFCSNTTLRIMNPYETQEISATTGCITAHERLHLKGAVEFYFTEPQNARTITGEVIANI